MRLLVFDFRRKTVSFLLMIERMVLWFWLISIILSLSELPLTRMEC